LSNTLFYRHVPFTDSVTTLRRLAPGDYRFKVFPDDILFEPADLVPSTRRSVISKPP